MTEVFHVELIKWIATSRCSLISVVSGNISCGKSTLCKRLTDRLNNAVYIEESFEKSSLLPLYYTESQRNEETGDSYNKYAYPVQLEFLENRFLNELNSDKLLNQTLILDRCLFEDYHIFAKTVHSLGQLTRSDE